MSARRWRRARGGSAAGLELLCVEVLPGGARWLRQRPRSFHAVLRRLAGSLAASYEVSGRYDSGVQQVRSAACWTLGADAQPRKTPPTRAPSTPGRLNAGRIAWENRNILKTSLPRTVNETRRAKPQKKPRGLVTCTSNHAAPRPRRGARRSSTSRCGTARTAAPSTRRRRRRSARAC